MNKPVKIFLIIISTICLGLIIWGGISFGSNMPNSFKQTKNVAGIEIKTDTITKPLITEPKKAVPKVLTYNVPVLMYHYIRIAEKDDELGVRLSVTPNNFNEQMKWLNDNNYQSIKLVDLADPEKKAISETMANKKKPVVITFDDGYEDAYVNAKPILEKYGLTGTFFIIKNFMAKSEYMNQGQITLMQKAGMEIGSHTLKHLNLATLDTATAKKEIDDSKGNYETFCYPAGKYNDETVKLMKEAGYKVAVTTVPGIANEKTDLMLVPRVRMTEMSTAEFAKKLEL